MDYWGGGGGGGGGKGYVGPPLKLLGGGGPGPPCPPLFLRLCMFNSVSYKLQQLQSSHFVYMYIHMATAALSHSCVSLTCMIRLTDCCLEPFLRQNILFDDIFETREMIVCQIE